MGSRISFKALVIVPQYHWLLYLSITGYGTSVSMHVMSPHVTAGGGNGVFFTALFYFVSPALHLAVSNQFSLGIYLKQILKMILLI